MEDGKTVRYVLSMIANKTGSIHSAIEKRNGIPNAYFKMIQLI